MSTTLDAVRSPALQLPEVLRAIHDEEAWTFLESWEVAFLEIRWPRGEEAYWAHLLDQHRDLWATIFLQNDWALAKVLSISLDRIGRVRVLQAHARSYRRHLVDKARGYPELAASPAVADTRGRPSPG